MTSPSLELFKKHVRADDFADDDTYLSHLLSAAKEHAVSATARSEEELCEMGGGDLPLPLVQAVMMLAAHWYNQRESSAAVQMHSVPESFEALVKPFRRLSRQSSPLCSPDA